MPMNKLTKTLTLFFLFCIVVGAIAVGTSTKENKFVLCTHWTAQSQFAGYILAEKDGLFKEQGVDVAVHYHDSVHTPIEMLESGEAQFATMTLFGAMEARLQGVKLVNVMQTSQQSSYCVLSQNKINSIDDLRGKEIAAWHGLDNLVKDAFSKRTDNTLRWMEVFSGIEVFVAGAVENLLVTSYNEIKELEDIGYAIDSTKLLKLSLLDLDLAEDGLYVTEDFYNSHREEVQKVVKALTDSWHLAYNDREYALDLVLAEMKACRLPHNRYHEQRMLNEILRLQCIDSTHPEHFQLREESFNRVQQLMKEVGRVDGEFPFTYKQFIGE